MRSPLSVWSRLFRLCSTVAAVLLLAGGGEVRAHKVSSASLILYLDTEEERNYRVETAMEVESSGDPALDDEIGPEDAALSFVESYLEVLIDEREQDPEISVKLVNESDPDTPVELQRLVVVATLAGPLPDDGETMALFLRETSPMSIVMATVKNGKTARRMQVMFGGEYSRSENIEPLMKENPFEVEGKSSEKEARGGDGTSSPLPRGAAPSLARGWNAILPGDGIAIVLLSIVLLSVRSPGQARAGLFCILPAESAGYLLGVGEVIPLWSWVSQACGALLLLLTIDILAGDRLARWRLFAAGLAALLHGLSLSAAAVTKTASGSILFLAGALAGLLVLGLVLSLSLLIRRKSESPHSFLRTLVAVLGGGFAIFLIVEPYF